jgi:hypothetical protein
LRLLLGGGRHLALLADAAAATETPGIGVMDSQAQTDQRNEKHGE